MFLIYCTFSFVFWRENKIIAELSEPILSDTATDAFKPQTPTKAVKVA